MKIIKIDSKNPDPEVINQAVKILENGGVIVYPTDTCYGLGADMANPKAVEKIYKIKNRDQNKPLSVIVKDIKEIEKYAEIDSKRKEILEKYLPGPITFILKTKSDRFNQETVGFRIPDYTITKMLANKFNKPYSTTSANISNQPVCYTIKEVLDQFKNIKYQPDLILDAGVLDKKNPPSVVVDLVSLPPRVLREGAKKIRIRS